VSATTQTDWPPLPYAEWEPTKQTVHRYTQIIGKVRMALTPPLNHWWHVTLLPATRGLTTGPMPYGDRYVEILLDLLDHRMLVTSTDGRSRVIELTRRPACADVYHEVFAALAALDVDVEIHAEPFDLGDSPPFAQDRVNDAYDTDAVTRFWRILASTDRVLAQFRTCAPAARARSSPTPRSSRGTNGRGSGRSRSAPPSRTSRARASRSSPSARSPARSSAAIPSWPAPDA
jgi:hypothetical protein